MVGLGKYPLKIEQNLKQRKKCLADTPKNIVQRGKGLIIILDLGTLSQSWLPVKSLSSKLQWIICFQLVTLFRHFATSTSGQTS